MRVFQNDKLPLPTEIVPKEVFDVHQDIDLEIGSGTGDFAISYSQSNPNRFLIAIERTSNKFDTFKNKAHPANLLPLHADARSVVVHCIPEKSLKRIFLLYPNPYPKKKQANQRWHNMPFFDFLLTRLQKNGEITFATNIEDYYLDFVESIKSKENLKLLETRLISCDSTPRTAFEKKYLLRGEKCWNVVLSSIE